MNIYLYGEITRIYQKPVFLVFFSIINNITENVSFQWFTYKNAKTDVNKPIWRNRITLPKRYILMCFWACYLQKMQKSKISTLYWQRKGHYEKRVWVFLSYLSTKKLKPTNKTLYRENFFFFIHLNSYRDAKILAKFMEIL